MTRSMLAVLASGRGSNFRAIAHCCKEPDFPAEVACLITDRADAEAVRVASEFGISVHFIDAGPRRGRLGGEAEAEIVAICRDAGVTLVVLAGFMRILRGEVLTAYAGRILNVHPSLLPSFPGLHAHRQALEYGVKVTGCTVHFVDASVDGGAIIAQRAVPVHDNDTEATLAARVLVAEHEAVREAIAAIAGDGVVVKGRRVVKHKS